MAKVALVETKPSRTDYRREFDGAFDFDQYQLCSDPSIKKVLKRDCDISLDTNEYDWVILVGSESFKYFVKGATSITESSGSKVDKKFLPVINPAMLKFKPEVRKTWEASKSNIIKHIGGELEDVVIDENIAFGIKTTEGCNKYIMKALHSPNPIVALDSETTGLYPRDGHVQGLSLIHI